MDKFKAKNHESQVYVNPFSMDFFFSFRVQKLVA